MRPLPPIPTVSADGRLVVYPRRLLFLVSIDLPRNLPHIHLGLSPCPTPPWRRRRWRRARRNRNLSQRFRPYRRRPKGSVFRTLFPKGGRRVSQIGVYRPVDASSELPSSLAFPTIPRLNASSPPPRLAATAAAATTRKTTYRIRFAFLSASIPPLALSFVSPVPFHIRREPRTPTIDERRRVSNPSKALTPTREYRQG